jgi:hypothetical protein
MPVLGTGTVSGQQAEWQYSSGVKTVLIRIKELDTYNYTSKKYTNEQL